VARSSAEVADGFGPESVPVSAGDRVRLKLDKVSD
jgi:hypothetical protein